MSGHRGMDVIELMASGMTAAEAEHEMNKRVFGENYKKRRGRPVEVGIGSEAHPSHTDIEATRRYYNGPDKEEAIKRKEANLAAYLERRRAEAEAEAARTEDD